MIVCLRYDCKNYRPRQSDRIKGICCRDQVMIGNTICHSYRKLNETGVKKMSEKHSNVLNIPTEEPANAGALPPALSQI